MSVPRAPDTAALPDGPLPGGLPGGLLAAVRPLDPAAPWVPAWRALGAGAGVQNPFYEAGYALAARAAFGAGVRLLLVADRAPEAPGARLLAAWPYRPARWRWGLPLPLLVGWTHGYCPFGAPLLDGAAPGRALAALLAAPRALGLPPRLLMPNAPADGALAALLAGSAARTSAHWPHARGTLDLAGLAGAARAGYLGHLSGKRRRKLRIARERLEAEGPVALEILGDQIPGGQILGDGGRDGPAALGAALDDHVALEAAGWKARAGTGLGQRPGEVAFLRAMMADLGPRDRLRVARLRRGGRTLASAILPLTGRGAGSVEAWVLKIAHDEADPAAAPGVQLVHRLTEAALAGEGIGVDRIDSCAPPGLALGSTFWTGRRAIAHLLVEAGHDPLFPLARALERARERAARARRALRR